MADCSHSGLFPWHCSHSSNLMFYTVLMADCSHSGLSPWQTVPTVDCSHGRLFPQWAVLMADCSHSGLFSIAVCAHGRPSPQQSVLTALFPQQTVPLSNCPHNISTIPCDLRVIALMPIPDAILLFCIRRELVCVRIQSVFHGVIECRCEHVTVLVCVCVCVGVWTLLVVPFRLCISPPLPPPPLQQSQDLY